ncbi:MAG TPA: CRISPR-associated ring nuclease Csm6, partial [Bryobacteraceae bacterium]|nr:CRISPR-associated ring nuclease Csm6 [Bryobacteraceae bacterium]
ARRPPFVPTEVHLLTTVEGAERARLSLLSDDPGWFARLCREYELPPIQFSPESIHVLETASRKRLSDIRTQEENEAAADAITEWVRRFTADPSTALHVSIAGGRKTMGFFAGYALSLLGRPQDRLSHVLVSAPFESHPEFFYPTRESRIIYTPPPDSRPLDTSTAQVVLADIPFVRLREWLPPSIREDVVSYSRAVSAARLTIEGADLVLDAHCGMVSFGPVRFHLAPAEFAFLAWMARRRKQGLPPVSCPNEGAPEAEYAREYAREYKSICGVAPDRTLRALSAGMEKSFFLEHKARLSRELRRHLGPQAALLDLRTAGRRPNTLYGLNLDPRRIVFAGPGDKESNA